MKTKLYKYQETAVRKIQHFKGRALLADEMGLGKTLETLKWLEQNPELRPAIVVCPASLKWVWEAEASLHLGMRSNILNGQKPPKIRKRFISKHSLIIINYEILQYWLKYLKALNPKVFILDEVHYIKSIGTKKHPVKRTRAVLKLGKKIPHIIGIGGTPLTNRPSELWPILHLIRPDQFNSLWNYRWRYCRPTYTPWGWQYKGASNLKELHRKLNTLMMIRRLKKDVLSELPDKTRQVIPIEIKLDEYQKALNNFIQWLAKKSATKVERAKRAERLVQMGYLKRLAASLKMDKVLNWIDDFLEESNDKLVLGVIHKNIIKQIHSKYKRISVVVDGSVTGKKRKIAIKTFQRNKSIRLFIGSIQAAGVGITLTAANTVAFLEMPWTPAEVIQFEDRTHRIGQKKAVMIYYLIAKDTIEESLCKLLQKKQAILSATLDGKKEINRLEIFNELQKQLLLKG